MQNLEKVYLFFDESGNTGTNWLDKNQPYYVYGGWLVKEEKKEDAEKAIKKIFSSSNARELKSSYILEKKRPEFKQLMDVFLFKINAIPVFGVADKRYMVAAKIIETFFDYAYNPNINEYLTHPSDLKKALADIVSTNQIILQRFVELIKSGTIQLCEMRDINTMLAEFFKEQTHLEVFETLINLSDDNLREMINEFESISKGGSEKKWLTLTESVLFDRLCNVEKFATICNLQVKPYVDELFGYQAVFDRLNTLETTVLKHFDLIEQCTSQNELLIQAADLLCGFINKSLIEIENSSKNTQVNEIWNNLVVIRDCFAEDGIIIWNCYAHADFIKKIGILVGLDAVEYKDECHKIISNNFSKAKK